MKHTVFLLACILLAILGPDRANAQITQLAPGDRVRISARKVAFAPIIGRIVRLSADSLVLEVEPREAPSKGGIASRGWLPYQAGPASLQIPVAVIDYWEVSQGKKKHTREGVLYGALAGGLIGGVALGLSTYNDLKDCESWCFQFVSSDIVVESAVFGMVGALGGGAVGAALGAVVGGTTTSDRWHQVPVHVSLGLLPSNERAAQPRLVFTFRASL